MIMSTADIGALRHRLGAEIDQALQTSDHLGTAVVGCYLQMARDALDESMGPAPDPKPAPAGRADTGG